MDLLHVYTTGIFECDKKRFIKGILLTLALLLLLLLCLPVVNGGVLLGIYSRFFRGVYNIQTGCPITEPHNCSSSLRLTCYKDDFLYGCCYSLGLPITLIEFVFAATIMIIIFSIYNVFSQCSEKTLTRAATEKIVLID